MKMPPSTTRSTMTAILRTLFLEKGIDITTEQAKVGELRPWLLPELVSDHQGRSLGDHGLLSPIHIVLHFGQHRGFDGKTLHSLPLLRVEHGGHDVPDLAARAPGSLVAEQSVAHRLVFADARGSHGEGRGRARILVGRNVERKLAEYQERFAGPYVVLDDRRQHEIVQVLAGRAGEVAVDLKQHRGRRVAHGSTLIHVGAGSHARRQRGHKERENLHSSYCTFTWRAASPPCSGSGRSRSNCSTG